MVVSQPEPSLQAKKYSLCSPGWPQEAILLSAGITSYLTHMHTPLVPFPTGSERESNHLGNGMGSQLSGSTKDTLEF